MGEIQGGKYVSDYNGDSIDSYLAMVAAANAIASAGVAPGGFGFGQRKTINRSGADALRVPGVFFFVDVDNPFSIGGSNAATGWLISLCTSYPSSSLGIVQLFIGRPYTDNVAIRVASTAGVWDEWELFNPPMVVSNSPEYRTAERCNGKVVYAKALGGKTLAATGTTTFNVSGSTLTNCEHVIRVEGYVGKAPLAHYAGITGISVNVSNLLEITTSGAVADTAYPVVYYTKT